MTGRREPSNAELLRLAKDGCEESKGQLNWEYGTAFRSRKYDQWARAASHLAQLFWWTGRQDGSRRLFKELLASRQPADLVSLIYSCCPDESLRDARQALAHAKLCPDKPAHRRWQALAVDPNSGSLVVTPPASGETTFDNYWETDIYAKDQLYHNVSIRTQVRALSNATTNVGIGGLDSEVIEGTSGSSALTLSVVSCFTLFTDRRCNRRRTSLKPAAQA